MFQQIDQQHFTFQEYMDTQRRAHPHRVGRSSDGGTHERWERAEQVPQVGRGRREESGHSGNFAKFTKFENNWNTAIKPKSNRDEEEGRRIAAPTTAPDENEEEEDVERLHMYVLIFNPEHFSFCLGCKSTAIFRLCVTLIVCA